MLPLQPAPIQDDKQDPMSFQLWYNSVVDTVLHPKITFISDTNVFVQLTQDPQIVLAFNTSASLLTIVLPNPTPPIIITVKNISNPTSQVRVSTHGGLGTIDNSSTYLLSAQFNSVTVVGFPSGFGGLNSWHIIGKV